MSTTMNAASAPPAERCTPRVAPSKRWTVRTVLVLAILAVLAGGSTDRVGAEGPSGASTAPDESAVTGVAEASAPLAAAPASAASTTPSADSIETTVLRPVATTACVVDERGDGVAGAIVEQYIDRTWGWGGSTGSDGCIALQAPTGSARFRVWVGGLWLRVDQNVGVDPFVVFELVDASVEVVDAVGGPVRGAVVEYFNGRWRRLGRTDVSGSLTAELLPVEVPIRVSNDVSSTRLTLDLASVDGVVVATQPLPDHVASGAKAVLVRGWQAPRGDAEYLPGEYRIHWFDGSESVLTLANAAVTPHDVDIDDPSAAGDPGTSGYGDPEQD
jgi:hypothetical protein